MVQATYWRKSKPNGKIDSSLTSPASSSRPANTGKACSRGGEKPILLEQTAVNVLVQIFEYIENHLSDTIVGMSGQVIFDGLHGNFGGQLVGETELAGGDATDGYGAAAVGLGQMERIDVARSQLFFLLLGGCAVGDDGSHGVDYILGGQVVSWSYDSFASINQRTFQNIIALLTQLHSCSRMYGVVDALVQRMETPQATAVGSVDNGIDLKSGDVALPRGN